MSPNPVTDSVVAALQWRYATKKFDPERKIPAATWDEIEQALLLSPSSYGLQPYKFVIVTDQQIKESLVPHSWGQTQPADCSHLVVFARLETLDSQYVDHYLDRIVEVRKVPKENLKEYAAMMLNFVKNTPAEKLASWMAKQCYIALGNLMTVASILHVDNCPMEGFVAEEFDRILGLRNQGLSSVVVCTLGYRSKADRHGQLNKVRFPAEELIIRI
jgi:nitroreductase